MEKYFKSLRLRILAILLLATSFSLLTSCSEGHGAGDLWGQWRLVDSDTKFISFSGSLVLVKDISLGRVTGNFQQTGDSLFMRLYSIEGLAADTLAAEQSFGFVPMEDVRLKIEKLSGSNLVLSRNGQRWEFYQY